MWRVAYWTHGNVWIFYFGGGDRQEHHVSLCVICKCILWRRNCNSCTFLRHPVRVRVQLAFARVPKTHRHEEGPCHCDDRWRPCLPIGCEECISRCAGCCWRNCPSVLKCVHMPLTAPRVQRVLHTHAPAHAHTFSGAQHMTCVWHLAPKIRKYLFPTLSNDPQKLRALVNEWWAMACSYDLTATEDTLRKAFAEWALKVCALVITRTLHNKYFFS